MSEPSMTHIEKIKAALDGHRLDANIHQTCRCGWDGWPKEHPHHVAEVIAALLDETLTSDAVVEAAARGIAESEACGSCAGPNCCDQCKSDARAAMSAALKAIGGEDHG